MSVSASPTSARPRARRRAGLLLADHWRRRRRAASGHLFGARLLVSYGLALAAVGAVGYLTIDHDLRRSQIDTYAAALRSDARSFRSIARQSPSKAVAIGRIDVVMDTIARRPGTLEMNLIDQQHVVAASGFRSQVGWVAVDPRIREALMLSRTYAGEEGDPLLDRSNFEFVQPLEIDGQRYAYEVSYDHRALDSQLNGVRVGLVMVGLFALLGGSAVFYLVGGRGLIRSHRDALDRVTRDGLTGLPNQRALQDELPHAIAAATRHQDQLAMLVLDVDDFKHLNHQHGHQHGDDLLLRVTAVLRSGRVGDRTYRVGGDEFLALLSHTDSDGARVLGQRLCRWMSEAGVRVSVGVASLRAGLRPDDLRAEADAALYEARRRGGDQVAQYDHIRDLVAVARSDSDEALRRLLTERGVSTVFQPIWDLTSSQLVGIEALTRPDPSYGLQSPLEAFDVAEQIGRIQELDRLCVETALSRSPTLPPGALLFLNVCPQTLELDGDRDDWMLTAVQNAGMRPAQVVVEVTERLGGRTAAVVRAIIRLREQGFKVALDDVGTGNAGLEMLQRVNAEFVKLDRSVVAAAPTDPSARAVLMAMATFARQTGAFVIAEGVEDDQTLAFLHAVHQQYARISGVIQGAQGYGLGRPAAGLPACPPTLLTDHSPADRAA
jgi:diguanylate cyclase (GGDEF)-like protein